MLGREKEREGGGKKRLGPNLEQPQGISFHQRGMERDMGGWPRLDLVFVFLILKIPSNAGHNS